MKIQSIYTIDIYKWLKLIQLCTKWCLNKKKSLSTPRMLCSLVLQVDCYRMKGCIREDKGTITANLWNMHKHLPSFTRIFMFGSWRAWDISKDVWLTRIVISNNQCFTWYYVICGVQDGSIIVSELENIVSFFQCVFIRIS